MNWTTLVDAQTLHRAMDEDALRIVDARFALAEPAAGSLAYMQSHLPGAVYAHLDRDLSDVNKAGLGRHPLPDPDTFVRRLGEWGITPDHQVVVYDAGDGSMAAARMWWMMKLLGHARVAVLDGGLAAWRELDFPETDVLPEPPQAPPYPASFDVTSIVSAEDVRGRLDEDSGWLFDARAAERFRGEVEPIDPVAGHVPGAVNRPFMLNLRDGRLKPAAELREELLALLAGRDPTSTVMMCGSGVTACHLLLAFEHAGLHGGKVYAGSWSGWVSDPLRPFTAGNA